MCVIILSLCFVSLLFSLSSLLSVVLVVVLITLSLELPQPMIIIYHQITVELIVVTIRLITQGEQLIKLCMSKVDHLTIINAVSLHNEVTSQG